MSWHERSRHQLPVFVLYGDPGLWSSGRVRLLSTCRSPASPACRTRRECLPARCQFGRCGSGPRAQGAMRPSSRPSSWRLRPWLAGRRRRWSPTDRQADAQFLPTFPIQATRNSWPSWQLSTCGGRRPRPVMMLVPRQLRVVPATVHIPLARWQAAHAAIAGRDHQDHGHRPCPGLRHRQATHRRCGAQSTRGEGGLIGSEEASLIVPAVAELAAEGIAVTGPHSADTLFHAEARTAYDAAIAMYHEQALIPAEDAGLRPGGERDAGAAVRAHLADHGTAYALAGTARPARAASLPRCASPPSSAPARQGRQRPPCGH